MKVFEITTTLRDVWLAAASVDEVFTWLATRNTDWDHPYRELPDDLRWRAMAPSERLVGYVPADDDLEMFKDSWRGIFKPEFTFERPAGPDDDRTRVTAPASAWAALHETDWAPDGVYLLLKADA